MKAKNESDNSLVSSLLDRLAGVQSRQKIQEEEQVYPLLWPTTQHYLTFSFSADDPASYFFKKIEYIRNYLPSLVPLTLPYRILWSLAWPYLFPQLSGRWCPWFKVSSLNVCMPSASSKALLHQLLPWSPLSSAFACSCFLTFSSELSRVVYTHCHHFLNLLLNPLQFDQHTSQHTHTQTIWILQDFLTPNLPRSVLPRLCTEASWGTTYYFQYLWETQLYFTSVRPCTIC